MTYAQIEKSLTENGFNLEEGVSPLKGMKFSNKRQFAFVWVGKENNNIKHFVEYVDIKKP